MSAPGLPPRAAAAGPRAWHRAPATAALAAAGAVDTPGVPDTLGALGSLGAPHRHRLADGREVLLRPVLPRDAQAEAAFVEHLSPRSRRLRFHGAVNQLPPAALTALTTIDQVRHVAFVAKGRSRGGRSLIVGDVRFVRDHCDDGAPCDGAEFAVAVADAWQGLGLGRRLLLHLGQAAAHQGVQRLHGRVLPDNEPLLALVRSLGGSVQPDGTDADVCRVTLPVPRLLAPAAGRRCSACLGAFA